MMNKRMIELVNKANEQVGYTFKLEDAKQLHELMDKFAELIIADAINTVEKRFMGDLNREDMEVRRCVADLKQHFGVEK